MQIAVMCVLVVTVLLATPVELRFYYADYVLPSLLQEYLPLRDVFCKCPPDLCVAVCPSLGVNGPILSGGVYGAKLFQRRLRDFRCHPEHVNATQGSLQSVYRFCCRTAVYTWEDEELVDDSANDPEIVTEKSKKKQLKEEEFEKDPEQEPLQEINGPNGFGNKSSDEDLQVEDVITDFVSDGMIEQPWSSTSTEPSSSLTGIGNASDDANAIDEDKDVVTDDSSSDALKDLTLLFDVSTAGALPHSEPTGNPPMLYVPTGVEQTVYVPMKDAPTGSDSSSETEKFEQAEKSGRVSKRTIDFSSLNQSYSKKGFPGQESTSSTEAAPATPSPVQTVLNRVRRIYDGYNTSYENNPWIGIMHFTKSAEGLLPFCSGSLIASRYVVTAAHCFYVNGEKLNATKIVFGVTDLSDTPGIVAFIAREIIHPRFSKTIYKHDIALVKLNEAVVPNSIGVRALHLPPVTLHPRVLTDIWVQTAGWGKTTKYDYSQWLQEVDLQVKANCCEHTHIIFYPDTQVCLVGAGDKSPCIGDFGGAVTLRTTMGHVLVAVISRYGCGVGQSSTSTFVPPYMPWILDVIYRHGE